MYSKAKISNHPIHPMLVVFPIAFYTAACAAYVYYSLLAGREVFWFKLAVVANVAGVITGVLAAIPGFIDWAFAVPNGSEAKQTGFFHMLLNVASLVLFAVSAWYNYGQFDLIQPIAGWGVSLSVLGLGFTMVSGYLGWKLVGTHHIGIDLSAEQERLDPTTIEGEFNKESSIKDPLQGRIKPELLVRNNKTTDRDKNNHPYRTH